MIRPIVLDAIRASAGAAPSPDPSAHLHRTLRRGGLHSDARGSDSVRRPACGAAGRAAPAPRTRCGRRCDAEVDKFRLSRDGRCPGCVNVDADEDFAELQAERLAELQELFAPDSAVTDFLDGETTGLGVCRAFQTVKR